MSFGLGLGLGLGEGGKAGGSSSTPLTILNDVCYWVRADKGWSASGPADQSTKANAFVQATPGNQPTINVADAAFNGRPSATFDGAASFWQCASFTAGSGADLFVWYVMNLTGAGSFPIFFGETTTAYEVRGNASTGEPMISANALLATVSWGSSIVGATKAVSAYARSSGGSPAIGVNVSNGAAVETSVSAFSVTNVSPIAIGARPGPSLFAPMKVAEIVVCSTMPTAPQLAALQAYAVSLYGSV